MAIYHMSLKPISRSGGRSAVACIAYRAGEKVHDERLDQTFDYSKKGGVEYKEILAPEGAQDWVYDRAKLWNEVERSEKRVNSRLAREVELALPKELSLEQQRDLVRQYAKENFVGLGMVADVAIHRDNPENPHAHIMVTTRELEAGGFGKKQRDWNSKNYLISWREIWAKEANQALAHAGIDRRIDHRSFEDQGIQLEPTRKLGVRPENIEMDGRDVIQDRWEEQQKIVRRNGEAIREHPEIALEAITHQQATFTQRDMGRWLHTRTADAEQFQACLSATMNSDQLVEIGKDNNGRERYTTREMLEIEQGIKKNGNELDRIQNHAVGARHIRRAEESRTLDPEQRNALWHVTDRSGDIAVVEGYAGTGKSYMLGAAREAWEAQGYRVLGAALAGKAAEGLEISSGIESRSIHSWEYAWKAGKEKLSGRDVFVIDEAGMVGSRQMGRVLEQARAAGAKVVLVGDTEQLQAIEAGAPMRLTSQEVGQVTLGDIRRQREEWQKQASQNLATGRTREALEAYEGRGHVHAHQTQTEALQAVVKAWDEHRKAHPEQTQIMLAYRRAEVREMNDQARAIRVQAGELGRGLQVETERGMREFASGDRVYFLRNDRRLGVKNGTLGTIERIQGGSMDIRLDPHGGRDDSQSSLILRGTEHGDSKKTVRVDLEEYKHLDHGYAATVHKSQGVTVDRSHVVASDLFDRHAAYVGLSRHRDQVDLHWSQETFEGRKEMVRTLSRARPKEMAVDYARAAEDNRRLAEQVEAFEQKQMEVGHGRHREHGRGDQAGRDDEREQVHGGADADVEGEHRQQRKVAQEPGREIPGDASRGQGSEQRDSEDRGRDDERGDRALGKGGHGRTRPDGMEDDDSDRARVSADGRGAGLAGARMVEQGSAGVGTGRADPDGTGIEAGRLNEALRKIAEGLESKLDEEERIKKIGLAAKRLQANLDKEEQRDRLRAVERDPRKVIREYGELNLVTQRGLKDAADFHRQTPEVRAAQEKVDQAKSVLGRENWDREQYERNHPLKARAGIGKVARLRMAEAVALQAVDKAKKAFDRVWKDPKLQEKSIEAARAYNQEIKAAMAKLEELKPYYERGLEVRDLQYVNERLEQHVRGRNPAGEYRKRLSGLRKRYGKAFDPRKADWVISKDLAKEGFSGEQIKDVLREESPAVAGLTGSKREGYVDRTVDRVMDLGEVKKDRQKMSRGIGMFLSR